jgi:hypothetical protein
MVTPFSRLSDQELIACLPLTRASERKATTEMIACLAEVDRRRLYLAEACSSLQAFCVQRLGYSENEAQKRIQVARLYQRLPQVLTELENGSVHLTGLFLLSAHLTVDNVSALLAETRGRTRREIEAAIARWFPRSDVLPSITPLPPAVTDISLGHSRECRGELGRYRADAAASPKSHLEPISATSYRVEFTASAALHDKIEQARNLLAHAVPSGDLAQLFERVLEALLREETKRRLGAGKPRRRRTLKEGSRHVPVEVARTVWERGGSQCTLSTHKGDAARSGASSRSSTANLEALRRRGEKPEVEALVRGAPAVLVT